MMTAVTSSVSNATYSLGSLTVNSWTGGTKNQSYARKARIEANTAGYGPRRLARTAMPITYRFEMFETCWTLSIAPTITEIRATTPIASSPSAPTTRHFIAPPVGRRAHPCREYAAGLH